MNSLTNTLIVRRAFVASMGAIVPGAVATGAAADATQAPPTDSVLHNVKQFGARGDGAADDTAAIQAAIGDAAQHDGGTVLIPAGTYKTTAPLYCASHHIAFTGVGPASILRPVGDFDTLVFRADMELYRNRLADLVFDEREKTGGRTLYAQHVAQFIGERLSGVFGHSGWHFHNFNSVTLNDCRFESYRGEFYGRATGGGDGDSGRSDVLRLFGIVHGGARSEGMIGLDVDGFVHTVSGAGVYLIAIGGRALWAHNSRGAANSPSFFTFDDLETDYPDGEAIRLDDGEHFYFNNTLVHASRAAANIHIGEKVRGVSFTGGFSTGAREAGVRIEGQSVALSAMHFHANSSPEFGGAKNTHPGIHIGAAARDVIVTGCHSGRAATADFQSCGCQIDRAADAVVITGNDFRHNVTPGVLNPAGEGPLRIIINNL